MTSVNLLVCRFRYAVDVIQMNLAISILSSLTIVFGLVSMLTPIPGGTLMIAGGLTALICTSPTARYCLMWMRSKARWIDSLFYWLETKVGSRVKVIGKALAKTHPPDSSNGAVRLNHKEFVRREIEQNDDAIK